MAITPLNTVLLSATKMIGSIVTVGGNLDGHAVLAFASGVTPIVEGGTEPTSTQVTALFNLIDQFDAGAPAGEASAPEPEEAGEDADAPEPEATELPASAPGDAAAPTAEPGAGGTTD